jgi:uncharacterized protein YjbI with pentapeptide repeats
MTQPVAITAPDLAQLDPYELPEAGELDELALFEARVDHRAHAPLATRRIRVEQSEVLGLPLEAQGAVELLLRDASLKGCDLSNIRARGGAVRRVRLEDSRLVGFDISEGALEDLHVAGGTMMLAGFARTQLQRVAFENVNLREASFMHARLSSVSFDGCDLAGADFRGARLSDCTIRGATLDRVVGVESLRGLTMPWPDLVGSAAALAAALGIAVEAE